MKRYSKERKEAIIQKMMPPLNVPISKLKVETGITDATLYTWRKEARKRGVVVPGDGKNAEDWSSEDKFSVVLETATLSEAELAEYCRRKGLFVEQIVRWKASCLKANSGKEQQKRLFRSSVVMTKRESESLRKS